MFRVRTSTPSGIVGRRDLIDRLESIGMVARQLTKTLSAVHDSALRAVLERISFDKQPVCAKCGRDIELPDVGLLIPSGRSYRVVCNRSVCISRALRELANQ